MSAYGIAAMAREFLCKSALPLWSTVGMDYNDGGFVERLHVNGAPDCHAVKRTLVQARQIYVYSHAAILGLAPDGVATAQKGFEFLMRHACPDGVARGFVHSMYRGGRVMDTTRVTYDHAFLLLAFSWFYRASGSSEARRAINSILLILEDLRHVSRRGYLEDSTAKLPRRQNPHMHLLEAFLAAYAATSCSQMLERAEEVVTLLEAHFTSNGKLREYFSDDLSAAPYPIGRIAEPGHHLEWVWLLDQYGRAAGKDLRETMVTLYRTARDYGTQFETGLVVNEIWMEGQVKDAAKRLWPQTEALKSELSMEILDGHQSILRASEIVEGIFRYFLDPAPPGAWIDRLSTDNQPLPGAIPATSLYHLFLAFSEYLSKLDHKELGSYHVPGLAL